MKKKILSTLFVILSIIYLLSLNGAPYSGQFIVKVAPILVLIVIATSHLVGKARKMIVTALIASGIGDVFLALTFDNSFIFGLGAFLVAQIIYSVTFIQHRASQHYHPNKPALTMWQKGLASTVMIYAVVMASYILPDTGDMMLPVAIYLTVITVMGVSAILGRLHVLVVGGALSFVASDSALALSLFKTPLPYSNFIVMVTYYMAQFAIVFGMLYHCQQANMNEYNTKELSPDAG